MTFNTKLILAFIFWFVANISSAATYHVSKNGNDSNSGLDDWVNAWETLNKVNDGTVQGGDTIFFGTGTWRGHLKLVQGTYSDRTCYACSSFALTNGSGDYHFAKIWGSVNYADSGWTQVGATNVYYTGYGLANGGLCCQADSFLWLQADSANVNSEGKFWISDDNSNLYVYLYNLGNGYDPSNYSNIELSHLPVVCIGDNCSAVCRSDSADYVTLYGLEFKYGVRHVIAMYGDPKPDSLFIEHCKISHATEYGNNDAENPACIYANNSNSIAEYLHVRACSVGYAHRYDGAGNHGCGIAVYAVTGMTIDSCTFHGFFHGCAIWFKHAYDYDPQAQGHVVKYNTFDQTDGNGLNFYSHTNHDSAYGNIFKGSGAFYVSCSWYNNGDPGHDIFFFNNTIYDCRGIGRYENTPAEQCDFNKVAMENVQFKYNILYATQATIGTGRGRRVHAGVREWFDSTGFFVIDSNLYCVNEQVYMWGDYAEGHWELNSTDWADLSYDLNSTWVDNLEDLGFTDPANGDFSRLNASGEMNRTYGGKTWTIYGAWQPDDPIPPPRFDTINDLQARPDSNIHGAINLDWTAPGINGDTSRASYYQIRYSTEMIYESNWGSATLYPDTLTPLPGGQPEEYTIDSLIEGQNYYIAIKAYNEIGIGSDISNVPDTFACGIMVPTQTGTEIDSVNSSVEVTSTTVESYMPIYYEFVLDSIDNFPDPVVSLGLVADTVVSAIFGGLSQDVSYFWRCCAISSDNTDSSNWSPAIEFNLMTGIAQTLNDSDCVYPSQGEIVHASRPVFTVRYVPDIESIFFQVDNNSQFNTPIESGPITTVANSPTNWQITAPIEQGITYYWRVSSNNIIWTSPIGFSAILDIHPYPNPFRASEGHTNVTFTNLPESSNILISTISGKIVLREDNIGPINWVWDVKNESRKDLAPGVYLYMIDFPSGSSSGKVLVIR